MPVTYDGDAHAVMPVTYDGVAHAVMPVPQRRFAGALVGRCYSQSRTFSEFPEYAEDCRLY